VFVVRYVALLMLALWVADVIGILAGVVAPTPTLRLVPYAAGGLIIAAFIVLKFVGPPPRAFPIRTGMVVLMLAIAIYGEVADPRSRMPRLIDAGFGLVLLLWYVRE
jgi:hypothetical protein